MTNSTNTIAALLLKEVQDREALDPNYYAEMKQFSYERVIALGIDAEIAARVYGVKSR